MIKCMSNALVFSTGRKKFKNYLPGFMKNIHSLFYYFLFLLVLGVIFFATSLFVNYFTTPFTGDYTSQQYAFYTNGYDDWWHFFKTGEFVLYDTNTYLGADNIGSNSFYYLFDPTFLPILLWPRQWIPQGMAILTIVKIAASGMTFFLYMRYMGASRRAAKITGIAYAFSGWMTWYLWFNHFTGVAIVFPLILYGIERVLRTKKPWVLAGTVALMGFVNYFFCICFVMCAFLYAMFRYFQRLKENNWKDNLIILGMGFLGFLIGLMIPMMVILPSAMHALTSPRASGTNYFNYLKEAYTAKNFKKVWEMLTSWTANITGAENFQASNQNKARSLYPFIEFIFPVTSCRGTPLTVYGNETYDNVAGSFYCFLPMTMLLAPALIDSLKKRHFSHLIPFAFFIFALFTPMFYYLFHGFTQAYSRWTLFVTTSILTYTGLYLDKIDKKEYIHIVVGYLSLIVFIVAAGISANFIVEHFGENYRERVPIWLVTVIELVYVSIMAATLIILKIRKKIHFYAVFTGFICVEVALMGAFVIEGHGVENYYYTNKGVVKNNVLHSLIEKNKKLDKSYYRTYSSLASSSASNDEMRNNYNGFNFFHSIYNYNTADISNWSSITNGTAPGSWSGTYVEKRINLDTLLGVKYYFVEDDYYHYQSRREASSENFHYNVPFNYVDVTDQYPNNEFRVYKNLDYIDFALTYENAYITTGDPTVMDAYTGLYSSGGTKDVLGLEDLYLKGTIINVSNKCNSWVQEELTKHPDINTSEVSATRSSDLYKSISVKRYGATYNAGATLTFYDISTGVNSKGEKVNSLGLTAKEYIELLNRDNDTFSKFASISEKNKGNRRWVAVTEIEESVMNGLYDPNGIIFYLKGSFAFGSEMDIYFVDYNDQIVTYDNHNDGFYSNTRNGKDWRTFYITPVYNSDGSIKENAPKIKKIIYAYRGSNPSAAINSIYVDTYTKFQNKYSKLKEHVVTDVKSSANTYTFKTDFDKERVVVTRLAYEDGFVLTMTDNTDKKQKIDVFNGQGGFVSFISGTGPCTYKLEFYTPYLSSASLLSALGVFTYVGSLFAYLYFDLRKKEKEEFVLFSRKK